MVHRIATSRHFAVSPHEIRTQWTWGEVLEAHAVLDAILIAEAGA